MAQKPLLFFPSREQASRSKLNGFGGKYHIPSPERQGERLTPKFQYLFDALEQRRIEIQQTPAGIDPEEVLVFETAGTVEDFSKAVSKIGGLEWLGEVDIENIEPDDDFYSIDDDSQRIPNKPLNGRLYLVFTNNHAMRQLLSLWNIWVKDGDFDVRKGDHRGKGKLKEVFKHLSDIRRWDVQDRFDETNILEYWEEDLELNPERVVRFEIELWFRSNRGKRGVAYREVASLLERLGGKAISSYEIPEIRYHAVLAELPATEIRKIISKEEVELVKCENIMYFKPTGQVISEGEYSEDDLQPIDEARLFPIPENEPIVAVLDGLPLSQHIVLKDRLIIDDPENYEELYPAKDRIHGTAMCSLVVNGDLSNNEEPISAPIYVRPIMRPDINNSSKEAVPDNRLLIDMFHSAVRRIFEGEGNIEAVAPNVKIINLSICDKDRLFFNFMSPWSRLLDWLSFKYRVLFIVSTGNHSSDIQLSDSPEEFSELNDIDKEKIILNSCIDNAHNSRLMSPSESINCITVGALHADNSEILANETRLNPYKSLMPATYTAFGGCKRSIKPNLVYYGGRKMYDINPYDNSLLSPSSYKRPPGIKVAVPSTSLDKTVFECGTSNATALISRSGYHCYEVLKELDEENVNEIPANLISVIIKAMLVHGCSWDVIGDELEKRLDIKDRSTIKKIKMHLFGYGLPDFNKVKECTEQRATVIGYGELNEEEAHIYSLPLPPSLASSTNKRKLTVTLAWFTPISPSTQKYRTARLWFEAKNNVTPYRQETNYDHNAVKRGTLQHEIFEGDKAAAFVDGDVIKIKVNCTNDASTFTDKIPYAILVSLEVAENVDIPIYQEISERISIPIAIRPQSVT
jgi:hypothetical protein